MSTTKLGELYFDNRILEAAVNGNLVIFAGAGVSMGAPSSLPSFEALASQIAEGTGSVPEGPIDRFLGSLEHSGVNVLQRAKDILSLDIFYTSIKFHQIMMEPIWLRFIQRHTFIG